LTEQEGDLVTGHLVCAVWRMILCAIILLTYLQYCGSWHMDTANAIY